MKINLLFLNLVLVTAFFSCNQGAIQKERNVVSDTTQVINTLKEEKSLQEVKIYFDYDTSQWTDLALLDSSFVIDMKYATTDNFVKEKMYPCGRCFLRPEVAQEVLKIHKELQEKGLGVKLFDCYRPRPIQWKLWEIIPDKRYVSDPRKGSMHNRGAAVDLTIVDGNQKELDMGTPFDFFGIEAYHTNMDLPKPILKNRSLLKKTMEAHGFKSIRTEWWHYSFSPKPYELADMVWECPTD